MSCPGRPVAVGWHRDGDGCWYLVDACERHGSQLLPRPLPHSK